MKLWVLKAKVAGYDQTAGVVVRARDQHLARQLASKVAGDEGPGCWLVPSSSSCIELLSSGKAEVVLRDFRAG